MQKDKSKSDTTIVQVNSIKGRSEKLIMTFQRDLNTILH